MKRRQSCVFYLLASLILSSSFIPAMAAGRSNKEVRHPVKQVELKRNERRHDIRTTGHNIRNKHVVVRPIPVARLPISIALRKRRINNVIVVRPYGHAYYGYGHHHHDNDAWKWLAFTAITLKVLDNVNEEAQRKHETAQIAATTVPVGEVISWETESASGSVTPVREGRNSQNELCREFQQTIEVGGQEEQAYGTACLQKDGSWKMV